MNIFAIQTAVYQVLSNDAALSALVTGVFDDVPVEQAHPYVTLGDSTHAPDDLLTENGNQATMTIHVWDRSPGYKHAAQIMDAIDDLLHRRPLAVSGTQFVSGVRELAEMLRDADGETRRGILRYRFTTFQ